MIGSGSLEGKRLHEQSLQFIGPRVMWYRPSSLSELLDIKRKHPDCKIVIGNTVIAHRKEMDASIVNAGMRVVVDDVAKVTELSLAFGGVSNVTVMATNTMKQLIGCIWNEELLSKACDLLTSDLPLDPASPGGMVEYRRTLTVSFFFKFYLTVLQQLQKLGCDADVKPADRIATEPLKREPVEGFQWFEVTPEPQSPDSALRRPLVHESAYKQASGEALFADDLAPRQVSNGDVDKAMAEADHVLEGEVHIEAQEHFYLEPQVTIAYPGEDGEIEVVSATQSLTLVQV
nr:hypothetical protein BaRGS_007463 [Batillaria attramentaria]